MTGFLVTSLVFLSALASSGCTADSRDVGQYRITRVPGGFAGFGCQARTELYTIDRSSPESDPAYLGTCGTPRFVTDHLHLPGDPSCFAVSEDSSSLVYFHRPNWCGAGEWAQHKIGGVYLHSRQTGDRLLYREPGQVGQVWSRQAIGRQSIRVRWSSAEPSRNGAIRAQNLIINADGSEQPEGGPDTPAPGFKGGRDSTDSGER